MVMLLRSGGCVRMCMLALAGGGLVVQMAMAEEAATCFETEFEVSLTEVPAAVLYGEVCGPAAELDGVPVQILLHGGAYDHRYWDPSFRPELYSYVAAATERGYVTVNLDRLGYGQSTRPEGRVLTFELGAEALNRVIDAIEGGELGFEPGPIILNGHSMGGIVAEHVAGGDTRIAGLIVSGLANTPVGQDDDDGDEDGGPPAAATAFVPATMDPRFAETDWADGYMVTAPGVRTQIFHAPGAIEEGIKNLEEELSETVAFGELLSVMRGGDQIPQFDGPALYVLGRYDVIACEGQDCQERFAGTDWHEIVEGAGHSINLSNGAGAFFELTFEWLEGQGLAP